MSKRIMVVEDSPPIRRSLIRQLHLIDENNELEIYDAGNGLEAINIIRENPMDILITDIQMPVMGGLELLQLVNKECPECVKIILSSYQEFEYAQEAIKQGVSDYLIKPVTEETMRKIIRSSIQKVREKEGASDNENWDKYIRGTIESLPNTQDRKYNSAIIIAGTFPAIPDINQFRAAKAFNSESYKKKVSELLSDNKRRFRYVPGLHSAEYIFSIEDSQDSVKQLISLYDALLNQSIPVTIVVDNAAVHASDIRKRIFLLRKACYENMIFAENSIVRLSDKPKNHITVADYEEKIHSIVRGFEAGSEKVFSDRLNEFLGILQNEKITEFDLMDIIENILLRCVETDSSAVYRESIIRFEAEMILSNSMNYSELLEGMVDFLKKYSNNRHSTDSIGEMSAFVRKVEKYIQDNYATQITSQTLADEFGFVPSYITKLFSMYLDTSPKKYLTKVRIEKAKSILESDPNVKVNKVAQQVGFNDAQYFSKVFHEQTGVWPTEYKNSSNENI